uniref:Uncharacterized protein TCIL3000_10_11090 n=1 Tax=Trypanosoma congolense (strain IL3000) TaxID=1068625 RepID=G0UY63_TRYCI|nr:unnamed protein product [Trypanosoma congolense IL3000]
MSVHLAEICKVDEPEAIVEYLTQLCPARAAIADVSVAVDEEQAIEDSFCLAANISNKAHRSLYHSFNGVWSFTDADGRTAVHWAVAMKNFSLASRLMGEPFYALVDSVDHDGVTPFLTACMVGAPKEFLTNLLTNMAEQRRWRIAYETFRSGGDVEPIKNAEVSLAEYRLEIINQPDSNGNTSLLHGASRGKLPIVVFLLQAGASIDHTNNRGQSALHRATGRGSVEVVEELVSFSKRKHEPAHHSRWMNIQDYRGDTALFYASMDDNEELGRYLLRQGARRDIRNKDGKEFWEV